MAATQALASPFLSSARALRAARPAGPARARAAVRVAAADRTLWLPGARAPKHLTGKMAGDAGFDPLGLGTDPERLKWYAEAEKTNGRWAMAAVAGILGQELAGAPKWYLHGLQHYWLDFAPLLAIQFLVLGFLELKRFQGWKQTGTSGFLNAFPFDPAGMNSPEMAVKEVKNGRLAMVAFIGIATGSLATREGPLAMLGAHLSSPFENNIIGSVAHLPDVVGKL